ncbi:hypothetical protein ACQKNX_24540 [Lysinibacillus sp. NPDC093712]|uniref:hypothetical protein n=1 Tax=Lysinibacillus sp. NPDC093712 TaxID=3390579 RepID=UPI003CFF3F5F
MTFESTDDLVSKLADARGELFEYDRMVETQMINAPEYVIYEMVRETKWLRQEHAKAVEYADYRIKYSEQLLKQLAEIGDENARLRKVLEFYANEGNYDMPTLGIEEDGTEICDYSIADMDNGKRAREALRIGEESNAL